MRMNETIQLRGSMIWSTFYVQITLTSVDQSAGKGVRTIRSCSQRKRIGVLGVKGAARFLEMLEVDRLSFTTTERNPNTTKDNGKEKIHGQIQGSEPFYFVRRPMLEKGGWQESLRKAEYLHTSKEPGYLDL